MAFKKTPKQIEACELMNTHKHVLLYGGSRSAKTTVAVRNMVLRAVKRPSRHLITRYRFNHAKVSLWYDTIPKVLRMCFPDLDYSTNETDWFFRIPTQCGGESQIWLGGCDDKERTDKVLGNEYSTILVNECSQVSFDAVTTLWSRLAEMSGLERRFYYDCNPGSKKHWSYLMFVLGMNPDKAYHGLDVAHLQMNPIDNIANLDEDYLKLLKGLPKRKRQRFLDGLFITDVEGALWNDVMVNEAINKFQGEIIRTVVAVDPSVSNREDSDECGIVVCSLDEFQDGVLQADLSGKMSTRTWAQRAVNAYYLYRANCIVAEVNQGGDLVEDAIHNIDPNILVEKVHASKGKFARAEPISMLYEQKRVSHEQELPELEEELTGWVPIDTKESPNRLDATVWGLTHLMIEEIPSEHHFGRAA